jgi:hypothetical protein
MAKWPVSEAKVGPAPVLLSRGERKNADRRTYTSIATIFRRQSEFPSCRGEDSPTGSEGGCALGEVVKHVGCHTSCHSLAAHLLKGGYDIRTIQELGVSSGEVPALITDEDRLILQTEWDTKSERFLKGVGFTLVRTGPKST